MLVQAYTAADVVVVVFIAGMFFFWDNGRICVLFEIFGVEQLGPVYAVFPGRADGHFGLIF